MAVKIIADAFYSSEKVIDTFAMIKQWKNIL